MIKKILLGLFILVALQCVSSFPVAAQFTNPCWSQVSCGYYSFYAGYCAPQIPAGGEFGCISSGTFGLDCWVMNIACTTQEACPQCAKNSVPANSSNPINIATGNTFINQQDVRVPGIGGGLSLSRTWNSVWPASAAAQQVGLFGPNWRSSFEEQVFVGIDHYIKYLRGDGVLWSFGYVGGFESGTNSDTAWLPVAPGAVWARLVPDPAQWTITFANGEVRTFDPATGRLLSIQDRNANTTQLTYDSSNRLVTVTDPASRHLYFGYASNSSYLVTSVTSDFGISLSYAYDAQGRLSQVTKPDSTTVSFTYNSQSLITAVTDSAGKILESHTYDTSGRGLTGSRAAGVEAVTIAY